MTPTSTKGSSTNASPKKIIRKLLNWLLLIFTLLFLISGLGISYFRPMRSITFGLLTKQLSYQIHTLITVPFIILLAIHIYFYPPFHPIKWMKKGHHHDKKNHKK